MADMMKTTVAGDLAAPPSLSIGAHQPSDSVDVRTGGGAGSGSGRTNRFYVTAWLLLGLAAAGYIGALAYAPETVSLGAIATATAEKTAAATRKSSVSPAEIAALETSLRQSKMEASRFAALAAREAAAKKSALLRAETLERELAAARGTTAEADTGAPPPTHSPPPSAAQAPDAPGAKANGAQAPTQEQTTMTTAGGKPVVVQIVNSRPDAVIGGSPAAAAGATPSAAEPATAAKAAPVDIDLPLPSRRPTSLRLRTSGNTKTIEFDTTAGAPLNPTSTAAIETGSIARPPAPSAREKSLGKSVRSGFGTAEVIRAATSAPRQEPPITAVIGVRLTSGPSIDALRLSWSLLTQRYGNELGGLEPRYVAGGSPASPFALIAGPLPNGAAALAVCAKLAESAVPCKVGGFTGNAL
ncbi:MAG: hypothetical protein KDJ37_14330 [Hyphomicrobiaceae bacterium]|nr:hypothetical protein [Hyphomicrobiaceae bacterium]